MIVKPLYELQELHTYSAERHENQSKSTQCTSTHQLEMRAQSEHLEMPHYKHMQPPSFIHMHIHC